MFGDCIVAALVREGHRIGTILFLALLLSHIQHTTGVSVFESLSLESSIRYDVYSRKRLDAVTKAHLQLSLR